MPEPEPEFEATANLSPLSPSPVHTASTTVVPALQDTVDTIDAIVEAVSGADAQAIGHMSQILDPTLSGDENEEFVDDGSFSDAYGEEGENQALPPHQDAQQDGDDDYAKAFDSPVHTDEVETEDVQDVPAMPVTSNASAGRSSTVVSQSLHTTNEPSGDDEQTSAPSSEADPGPDDSKANDATAPASEDVAQRPAPTQSDPSPDESSIVSPTESSHNQRSASNALQPAASLPPRPPAPETGAPSYPSQHHPQGSVTNTQTASGQTPSFAASTASAADILKKFPQLAQGSAAAPALQLMGNQSYAPPAAPTVSVSQALAPYERAWEQYLSDERQYMAEAKWDRFPEGSRIFIGNLSADKISKREVFDLFHRFGRLAQISLKSAYGFVQYHTPDEGSRAIDAMQGIEVKGRRIHLEVSKLQDNRKKERQRSPDRGRDGSSRGHGNDRDHRSNRSPRRNEYSSRDHGHTRNSWSGSRRDRSRSPEYRQRDSYRHRSPTPRGRSSNGDDDLELPRRYGSDVPDAQIILQPDLHRDFVSWVEGALKSKGLKVEVMYLHPRMPKEQVVQRQAVEGVHAVIDLDLRAQSVSKIPVQVFDRSGGSNNVRFDQYVDLDPGTAAEVVLRAKTANAQPAYGGQSYGTASAYPTQYGSHTQPPANPTYQNQPAYQQPAAPQPTVAHLASLMGQLDNNTLQTLLSTLQGSGHNVQAPSAAVSHNSAAPSNPQLDIAAILGSLGTNSGQLPPHQQQQQPQYGAQQYGSQASGSGQPQDAEQAAQIQNIMSQLARFRQ